MKRRVLAGVLLVLVVISIIFIKDVGLPGSDKTQQSIAIAGNVPS
ncbi:hypothetical protein [Xenorhabdus cabanillasii]